ncbi:MAG: Uma2 family endonuclease [Roseofilum sp. SBFL]|uniref:Uma2 family endonuclease n=1 Tax=unclassified Roseofilum TaxID=2620099 RepID=UPI001B1B83F8|nr:MULTISPECIES: Uma2 family endonuclease [unclassified Roseofilum]MBP0014715.1 Uma2 family endonuclease [Roseofilum sp. SID3]MBP0025243.1 Uma2 family endonuclease [Roseofilum sp. SID2]MBP0037867.1 Uma2 family endonuclease [Roseofilum sp. SID1]MBP0042747.1 Uma2 family endonuclease [Roseofilum sp. SBFL]
MIITPTQLSLEEFLQLPETQPSSEYIDGHIYTKPMPKGRHSAIQTRLVSAINQVGTPGKIARAFTELRCTFAGRSLVPDISVFTWSRIPLNPQGEIEDLFTLAPDWTIEILSPEQPSTRVIDKILFCLDEGTELGWLIDPQERLVMSFSPEQQPRIYQGDTVLPCLDILPDFQSSGQTIFSYLTLN